jgi:hypothetical protein
MPSVIALIGALTAAILTALGLIHVYWAAGGRAGHGAALPERDGRPLFQPSRAGTLMVAAALVAAAALIAVRSGLLGLPWLAWPAGFGAWALAAIFTARAIGDFRHVGFFKRAATSRFARLDSALFSPLCLLLGILAAIVAAS